MTDPGGLGTEHSLKDKAACKLKGHDWRWNWKNREKECYRCGVVRPIEKEYSHSDEDAEIGERKLVVEESERNFRVESHTYRKTAHGPDDAYFQWFPDGGFYTDEDGLEELQSEINCALSTDSDQYEYE